METLKYFSIFYIFLPLVVKHFSVETCTIPTVLNGKWFSVENHQNTITEIDVNSLTKTQKNTPQNKLLCLDIHKQHNTKYSIVFKNNSCYSCLKIYVRTNNILEKIEGDCISFHDSEVSVEKVCKNLDHQKPLITLFKDDYKRVSCKNSIQGVYTFAYQNSKKFKGECNNAESRIESCQIAERYQFLILNDKFTIEYKACKEIEDNWNANVDYACLGDWYVNKNHYFAVANTRESRREEKYRCFIRNEDEKNVIGISTTAECNTLKSPRESPEILTIKPINSKIIESGCQLANIFSGQWINNVHINGDIQINDTHIIETNIIDDKTVKTIYICKEKRGNKVLMARVSVEECPHDYVCFDFLPTNKNIIRYRTGRPTIQNNFESACGSRHFEKQNKLYSYYLKKKPQPVKCPIGGKFNFTQKGDFLFETRNVQALQLRPPNVTCSEHVSEFCAACDREQNEISIDADKCLYVDYLGRPIDLYVAEKPDIVFKCIGHWKENNRSYFITYDEMDPLYPHHCWVYHQDTKSNKILLSQALGSYCATNQNSDSSNATKGAAVSLELKVWDEEKEEIPFFVDD